MEQQQQAAFAARRRWEAEIIALAETAATALAARGVPDVRIGRTERRRQKSRWSSVEIMVCASEYGRGWLVKSVSYNVEGVEPGVAITRSGELIQVTEARLHDGEKMLVGPHNRSAELYAITRGTPLEWLRPHEQGFPDKLRELAEGRQLPEQL